MKKSTPTDLELRPDGWERFNRAVTAAVKSGPKHREKSKAKKAEKTNKSQRAKI